ncbi:MAG: 3'-5' exonuclease, partial [Prevotella sp.]
IDSVFGSHAPQMDIRTLCTNRRSQRRIIQFNNALFSAIAKNESAEIAEKDKEGALSLQKAYADVRQEIPTDRELKGYVNVTLLPNNENYNENTLDILISSITEILAKGHPQSSIAILVRANRFIPVIAAQIKQALPELSIISDEAFRLDASLAVNTIVTAMKYMADADNELALAFLVNAYQYGILHQEIPQERMFQDKETTLSFLPQEFIQHMESLYELPLPDMADRLYALFELDRLTDEGAYVCALYDCLMEYTDNPPADLPGFINEWDSTYADRTIQSDGIEGIHILSIHKSKGLEYEHVLLPYCDWQIESYHADNVVWCKPAEEPYNRMPLVPIDFSKKAMSGTIYETDYLTEHLQNTVDNLNLLYVALTRARSSLIIIGKKGAASTRSYSIELALDEVQKELPEATLCSPANIEESASEEEMIGLKYGELDEADSSVIKQDNDGTVRTQVGIRINHSKAEYKQSNRSIRFLQEEKEEGCTDVPQGKRQMYIQRGALLHQLMSNIQTVADVNKEIRLMESEGVLDTDIGMSVREIETLINSKLQQPEVRQWFDGTWILHNECSIITRDEQSNTIIERRPDRVMSKGDNTVVLDFKFGNPMAKHQAQVKEYVSLLEAMGYKHVKGYLWYVFQDLIISL